MRWSFSLVHDISSLAVSQLEATIGWLYTRYASRGLSIVSNRNVTSETPDETRPGISLRQLGERVRSERGDRGIRDAAKEINVSPATLSRIERGYLPDLTTFGKLCRWLKLDPAEILGIDVGKRQDESSGRVPAATALVHLRAEPTVDPELATALAQMILAAQ